MQTKQNRMRFLITALIPIFAGALIAACDLPASPKPTAPQKQPDAVTYFGNGNTAGEAPQDTNKYKNGDPVTVMGRGNLYRVGYHFTGWNTKIDGSGRYPDKNGQITMENDSLKLYAKWEEVFPRVGAGENFSTLVTEDGKIYAAGYNQTGQLGDGTNSNQSSFTPVKTDNIKELLAQRVFSGTDHSFAILSGGNFAGWGRGDYGKLGLKENDTNASIPTIPYFSGSSIAPSLKDVRYISAGRYQTALLTGTGEYWAAGTRYYGALGNGAPGTDRETQFTLVASGVISVAAGYDYVLLVKTDGDMWVAGRGGNGRLGTGQNGDVAELQRNYAAGDNNAMVFAGKNDHSMVLKKGGRLLSAGNNANGQLGHGDTNTPKNFFQPVKDSYNNEITDVAFVSLGYNHSMILKNDGTLWAVGRNNESQFGAPQQVDYKNAVMVLDHVAHVAAGYNHTLAVKEDGTLWAAGSNSYGQLGRPRDGGNSKWTKVVEFSPASNPSTGAPSVTPTEGPSTAK